MEHLERHPFSTARRIIFPRIFLFLFALIRRASAGSRIYSIEPIGGPVRGGQLITVRGHMLENIECIFTAPDGLANAPPPVGVPCLYSPDWPDVGFRCTCETPAAPRPSELQQNVDPTTGVISMDYVPIGDYYTVPIVVTPAGSRGVDFSPFDITFTYYDLNGAVNVTSIEPKAGHPEMSTLVTVTGNGFRDYSAGLGRLSPGGGVYCSYPGPSWDPLLPPPNPDYEWQDFTSPATIVNEHRILCTIPPMTNNSDPVFLEVCLSGHPDVGNGAGRPRRDDFCTNSLVRFDYVDVVRTNMTIWNTSVLAGPIQGGTAIRIFGKYGLKDFLTLQPEIDGFPDHGRPMCVFGLGLGRGAPRPPTRALAVPANLTGQRPLMFGRVIGDNTSVIAEVGRKRMCTLPGEDARGACSCVNLQVSEGPEAGGPPCGCGCRELLRRSGMYPDFDMCVDMNAGDPTQSDIMCGPIPSEMHRKIDAVPAVSASCFTPAAAISGLYELEFAPSGNVRATSNSKAQRVDFVYYDVSFASVTPLAAPLEGGTRFLVTGRNMAPFAMGTRIGEANIYGVASQFRIYDALPVCFIGAREREVAATLEGCTNIVDGWMSGDEVDSGCNILRCEEAPPIIPGPDFTGIIEMPLKVAFNGQWDSAQTVVTLKYFDNAAVAVSAVTPSAGPLAGGTPIEMHGAGFVDLGNPACVLTIGATRIVLVAIVETYNRMVCTPDAEQADAAVTVGNGQVQVGVVLNGDPATIRFADTPGGRTFYFVDMPSIRLSSVNPPAGPIRGGTTLVLAGDGLRACGGQICPGSPLCIFEMTNADGSPGNQTVTGLVMQRGQDYAVHCNAPTISVISEDATERPPPAYMLSTTIQVAILGYIHRPGNPSVLIADIKTFSFYDAAVQAMQPRGGPHNGGTAITLSGRALGSSYLPENSYPAARWYRPIMPDIKCVFLASPPPAYGATGFAAQISIVATATATAIDGGRLVCNTPNAPYGVRQEASGVKALYVEAALNGYLDEHTRSTVVAPPTFTYYRATISQVHPLGGPTAGGTVLTLHGSNLADYGGVLCRFSYGTQQPSDDRRRERRHLLVSAATKEAMAEGRQLSAVDPPALDISTSATIVAGDAIGGGTVKCVAPTLTAERLALAGGAVEGFSLPSAADLQLTLNGDISQTADATPCAPSAVNGDALLRDVALAANGTVPRPRCYAYFDPASVRLSSIHPRGGPHVGGTPLTLHGTGFHTFGGLGCVVGEHIGLVPATRISSEILLCATPANGPLPSTGRKDIRLTLNDCYDAMPPRDAGIQVPAFTYYNAAAVRAKLVVPNRGGALGSTLLTVHGNGFSDYGGVLCRFGPPGMLPVVAATLLDSGKVLCRSPPYVLPPSPPSPPPFPPPNENSTESSVVIAMNVSELPPLPSRLPVHVLLNGEPDEQSGGEAMGGGDAAADAAPDDATFVFEREPCDGIVIMRQLQAAVDDGLGGSPIDAYGGAPRNCTWRLMPGRLREATHHELVLTFTSIDLREGFDTLTVHDGDGVLLHMPGFADAFAGGGCTNATGSCLQSVVAKSGTATVNLVSEPRTDGTASRLSMRYITVGPPERPELEDSMRPEVTHHPFAPDDLTYMPLASRRAEGWTPPSVVTGEDASDGNNEEETAWPGVPAEWESVRRLPTLDRARTLAEGSGAAHEESAEVQSVRVDPSGYAGGVLPP